MIVPPSDSRPVDEVKQRIDFSFINEMITQEKSHVLDIGCGDGQLLTLLVRTKKIDGRGLELSQAGVNTCLIAGLAVVQGDADTNLTNYPDNAFDYVILGQTIQATRNPREVLLQMKRIGRKLIVSLPNFGHWQLRLRLLWSGRMPVSRLLDHAWYDTPNIHLCTISDFVDLCDELGLHIDRVVSIRGDKGKHVDRLSAMDNLLAESTIFLIS